jgi:hypothetical protein
MKDYRHMIGRHSNFDDHRHWEFVRNTRLPRDTFQKKWRVDNIVFVALSILIALALLAVNLGDKS